MSAIQSAFDELVDGLDQIHGGVTQVAQIVAQQSATLGDMSSSLDSLDSITRENGERNAAVGTWPTSVPALLGTPIDHVLATPNWRFTGFRVLGDEDSAGSDHRPVIARLAPAG